MKSPARSGRQEIPMRLVRYHDESSTVRYGAERPDGASAERLDGDPWSGLRRTGAVDRIALRLAPIAPTQILCIGLNYHRHAAETGAKVPERPVVFAKSLN